MNEPTVDYRSRTVAERIDLVQDVWYHVAEDSSAALRFSPAQRAEFDRRLAAHRADPGSSLSWDAVRTELSAP